MGLEPLRKMVVSEVPTTALLYFTKKKILIYEYLTQKLLRKDFLNLQKRFVPLFLLRTTTRLDASWCKLTRKKNPVSEALNKSRKSNKNKLDSNNTPYRVAILQDTHKIRGKSGDYTPGNKVSVKALNNKP